jgi:hypothetical protein
VPGALRLDTRGEFIGDYPIGTIARVSIYRQPIRFIVRFVIGKMVGETVPSVVNQQAVILIQGVAKPIDRIDDIDAGRFFIEQECDVKSVVCGQKGGNRFGVINGGHQHRQRGWIAVRSRVFSILNQLRRAVR